MSYYALFGLLTARGKIIVKQDYNIIGMKVVSEISHGISCRPSLRYAHIYATTLGVRVTAN